MHRICFVHFAALMHRICLGAFRCAHAPYANRRLCVKQDGIGVSQAIGNVVIRPVGLAGGYASFLDRCNDSPGRDWP